MKQLIWMVEGLRMLFRRFRVGITGIKKYSGNPEQICKQIIDSCWNGKFFQVSSGHFQVFYCRDFSWVVKSLIKLGYKDKVRKTLDFVLSVFRDNGGITTCINRAGKPFDFTTYGPDSLASILYSLSVLGDKKLVYKYKSFLEGQILRFSREAISPKNGLIRKDRSFSSMKDHSIRKSSCYDNCMAFVIQKYSKKLGLKNNLNYNYEKLIIQNFWNGKFFFDDLTHRNYIAGDAQVFPFYTEVIKNKEVLRRAISAIRGAKLDIPFPLKYTNEQGAKLRWFSFLVPNYEKHNTWMHMGLLFVKLVDKNLQKKYLQSYTDLVLKHKNFLEVYTPEGKPYHNLVYYSDESMIWCANYLAMIKKK